MIIISVSSNDVIRAILDIYEKNDELNVKIGKLWQFKHKTVDVVQNLCEIRGNLCISLKECDARDDYIMGYNDAIKKFRGGMETLYEEFNDE